jgi:hypothetical protein
MTDPKTVSGALWMLTAELRAAAHAGASIQPDRALMLSVTLGNLAHAARDLETAEDDASAARLAAIEAGAARNVVRFPPRWHSDAAHGDGQVA